MSKTPSTIHGLRLLAIVLIDYLGPLTAAELASQLCVWREVALAVLDHPAFERYPQPWGGPKRFTLRAKLLARKAA